LLDLWMTDLQCCGLPQFMRRGCLFCIQMLRHTRIHGKLQLRWKHFTLIWLILLSWLMDCNMLPRRLEPSSPNKLIFMTKKKCFWKPHIECNPISNTCQMHPCPQTNANKIGNLD
jgi:hypothetical protein